MTARTLTLLLLLGLASCQGEDPTSGGVDELPYDGGALDGSEDGQLPDVVVQQVLPSDEPVDPAGGELDAELRAALEAKAAAYETMPIDELLASMGLARD
ncbi:MAG: hypothetical protein P8R43_09160, partial [Planctomycetota bacterium]|nr:hypothetical protein [Planctomycetota bacterium]